MSELWLPKSGRPAQIAQKERVCVLVHKDTGRILCFCRDDPFTDSFQNRGYKKIELMTAHDYDTWAKRYRHQAAEQNAQQDFAYLERENAVRQRLRSELRAKLTATDVQPAQRMAIESALHCLDFMEDKRKRYRKESFMVQEAYEQSANPGEDLVHDLIDPKK